MPLRELWLRLTYPLRRARLDRELRQEMDLHVALRAERLAKNGVARDEAAAMARRRFGNRPRLAAAARDAWGWHWLDGFGQDTLYIVRQLRRTPGFAVVVCVTIALGVAINAAAFSFYDAVALKPLAVADPGRVVRVTQDGRAFGFELLPFSAYEMLRRDAHALQDVTASTPPESFAAVLPGDASAEPRAVTARFATPDFARALGVRARIGRWFDASDDAGVVLDHTFWTNVLGADPAVVGRTMRVGDRTVTIIGVAAADFAGPGMPAAAPNLWLPASMIAPLTGDDRRHGTRPQWQVVARLAPTATLAVADGELTALRRSVVDSAGSPLPLVARKATFFQTDAGEFEAFQQAGAAFLVALALMLGIAAVNLVNLFASRNLAREGEITVRLALGASRGRIARQLASESVLLAVLGGALGLLASRFLASAIARWMMSAMAAITGGMVGVSLDLGIDWRIVAYAAALSIGLGLAVGVWPAWRTSRGDVTTVLRQGGAATAGTAAWGKRHLLLAVQVASCIVLLTAAGALLAGMRLSSAINPRFDADHMLVAAVDDDAPPAERLARRADIARRLAALPDVRAVAWTRRVPFGGTHLSRVTSASGSVTLYLDDVGESYFDAMGLPIVRGRSFTRDEVEHNAPVMVISEAMAHLRWPNGDAIGRSLPPHDPLTGPDTTKAYTVIGIVPDIRSQFLSRLNGPAVYYPYGLANARGSFLVRTRGEPAASANEVRLAVASISPALGNRTHVITMKDGPMALQRLMARVPAIVALALAIAGLGLASVGVYGVISQIVTRRSREIGIHLALGAGRRTVVWLVATKTLRPVAWGVAAGCVGAVGVSLALRAFIRTPDVPDLTFGAGAFNPTVLAGVLGTLGVVVAAALFVPARRALTLDPARTLRAE